jgi:AsmA protein
MRGFWIWLLAIVILVPVLLAVGLSLVPDSVYRERITQAVKSATGRDLVIGGDIGVSLFPLGASVKDVALSNAPGFSAPQFASMKSLDVGIALIPLITGKVEIARFVLVEPKIALEVDENGKNNWTFQSQTPAEAPQPAETPQGTQKASGVPNEISLGDVKLDNGLVSYANRQSGEQWEASAITIEVSLPSLDKPASLDGSATWKGKPVKLALKTDKPRAILDGTGGALSLKVDSDLLKASFDGTAASGDKPKLNGTTDLAVTSVRDLSAWLAKPMTPGRGFGPLAIKGNLAAQSDQVDFKDATVNFDKIDGTGSVQVRMGGERPHVNAELDVGTLDTTPYMGGGGGSPGGSGGGGAGGAPAGGGWSTEPLDLSGLKAIDGDFRFLAKKVLVNKLTFTDSVLAVTLKDGILFADLSKLSLYGGTGRAKLVVGGAAGTPEISADMAFAGIAIEPFLRDAANFDRLAGTGNLTLSVKSQGGSQKAIASNMNGSGAMKLKDGAIKGINLGAMVRNITGAFSGAGFSGGPQQTDFASLGGSWTIANGVLSNSDMEMLNPLLRVQGAGTADIGNRTVNYVIVPKAVASAEGQGGKTDLTGVSVPVRVSGSWDHLTFAPDPKGLLEGALKGLTDAQSAGQDPLKGALKGLLGQPGAKTDQQAPAQSGQPAPAKKEKPAEQLLKGLLGGGK